MINRRYYGLHQYISTHEHSERLYYLLPSYGAPIRENAVQMPVHMRQLVQFYQSKRNRLLLLNPRLVPCLH